MFFSRRRVRKDARERQLAQRERQAAADQGLTDWIEARKGVEVFVEPETSVTRTTMLFVAHDGQFTRRPVQDVATAIQLARSLSLPVYDAAVVGYPQRMRDFTRKQNILRKRQSRDG